MNSDKPEQQQKKSLSESFVSDFATEVNQLSQYYVAYSDSLNTIKHQYGEDEDNLQMIEPATKEQLLKLNQVCRQLVRSSFIKYQSFFRVVSAKGEIDKNKEIENPETYMFEKYLIDVKELQKYIIELNEFLTNHILKDLLVKAYDYS